MMCQISSGQQFLAVAKIYMFVICIDKMFLDPPKFDTRQTTLKYKTKTKILQQNSKRK